VPTRSTPVAGAGPHQVPAGRLVRGRQVQESLEKLRAQLLSWAGVTAGGAGRRRNRSASIKVPPARSMSALAAAPGLISGMGAEGGGGGGPPPPPPPGGMMIGPPPPLLPPPGPPPGPLPGPMANPGAAVSTKPTSAAKMTRAVPIRRREWRMRVLMAGAGLRGIAAWVRMTRGRNEIDAISVP